MAKVIGLYWKKEETHAGNIKPQTRVDGEIHKANQVSRCGLAQCFPKASNWGASTNGKGCNFSLSSAHAASWLAKLACWQLGLFPVPSLSSLLWHKHTGGRLHGKTKPDHSNARVSFAYCTCILCVFQGNLQNLSVWISSKGSVLIWAQWQQHNGNLTVANGWQLSSWLIRGWWESDLIGWPFLTREQRNLHIYF